MSSEERRAMIAAYADFEAAQEPAQDAQPDTAPAEEAPAQENGHAEDSK